MNQTVFRCHFCGSDLLCDDDEMFIEEVGEFWSNQLNRSVLAHPDCLPLGIDATQSGQDPEWKMA